MPDPLSTPTTTPGALGDFGDNVISDSAAKTFADNAKAIARAYSLLVGGGTEYGTTEPPAGSGVPTPPASPLLPPPTPGVTFNETNLSVLLSGLQSTNAQETMSNLIDEMRSDSKAEEAATDVAISKLQDQVTRCVQCAQVGLGWRDLRLDRGGPYGSRGDHFCCGYHGCGYSARRSSRCFFPGYRCSSGGDDNDDTPTDRGNAGYRQWHREFFDGH